MPRSNLTLVNVAGGEVSQEMEARLDLPLYQKGYRRIQNYIVLPQGGLYFRNGHKHAHNTRGLGTGELISFSFSEEDTYVIEITDRKMRFYRNFGAILEDTSKNIEGVTRADPAVITSTEHGYSDGDEVYISGNQGMPEINDQFFLVANKATDTFQLQTVFGEDVDSSAFGAWSSGGTIRKVYEIDSPYREADIPEIHSRQSADTVYLTRHRYPPFKLTRTGHTAWSIAGFDRNDDPFEQAEIASITKANPGVFTTVADHKLAVDDEVFVTNNEGMTELNWKWYKVNSVPSASTFTLKDAVTGVPLNTSALSTYAGTAGRVIKTANCPKTCAFLGSARLVYGNWPDNPAGLAFSKAPDSSTGETQFDNFTPGADATDAVLYTLGPVFDKQDAVQWISVTNKQVIVGCASSVRRVHGDTINDPISPSSINALPINNIGAAAVQAFSSGQSMFYVDSTARRIQSFLFNIQADDFVTVNQSLVSSQLAYSPFKKVAQQRGDSGLLWVLREDGVLAGMTFNELESIFGWHRHYIGGTSQINNVSEDRAKVLSIAVEPRLNAESVLWLMVERTVGGRTYRSVEYMADRVRYVEKADFVTSFERSKGTESADKLRFANALYEQLKGSIHLDAALEYNGSAFSTMTMTPSGTTGVITLTAGSAFFTASMEGREIWKLFDSKGIGGGRALIKSVTSSTTAAAEVVTDFDNSNAISAGGWALSASKVYGLLHLAGETVSVVTDGAYGGELTVAADGSVTLEGEASRIHLGYGYKALGESLNLDAGGQRGSAQAKVRKMVTAIPRFINTLAAKIGTSLWDMFEMNFHEIGEVTDRPAAPANGAYPVNVDDSYEASNKVVVIGQDKPLPQTLLSFDVMVETADD